MSGKLDTIDRLQNVDTPHRICIFQYDPGLQCILSKYPSLKTLNNLQKWSLYHPLCDYLYNIIMPPQTPKTFKKNSRQWLSGLELDWRLRGCRFKP